MLVMTALFSICTVFIAFLLRFLFALESELWFSGRRAGRVERFETRHALTHTVAGGPALTLVHSNAGLAPYARLRASGARLHAMENSRAEKEA